MMQGSKGSRRILFVDDDQAILDGLRNLLRKQRWQWDMSFVKNGQAALDKLASPDEPPFDVIVTDMRMPGMDGAVLLSALKADYPEVTRIVLSGHADRVAVQRALSVAHQFLAKPCNPATLKVVVERVCALHVLLDDPSLRQVVGKLDKLPSVPQVYLDLVATLDRPESTIGDIAAVIERDPAMSVKVLQLVNSSYFGLGRHMASISEAVGYLGSDLLRSLALSAGVFARMEGAAIPGFSLEALQNRGLIAARVARAMLADDPRRAEEAFTAALVRDIGTVVLAHGLPDELRAILAEADVARRPAIEVERERLHVSHAEIGAYLLGTWGLPAVIVEAVAFHHDPGLLGHDDRAVAAAVHVADAMSTAALAGEALRLDRDALALPPGLELAAWLSAGCRELRKLGLTVKDG